MPNRRISNAVRLEFESAGSHAHANLSGAACTGEWLWVAGDEACEVNRLRRLEPLGRETLRLAMHAISLLPSLLDLPGASDDEADLEGMTACDGYLWVVGSHGLKRKNAKRRREHAENAKRLAKTALDANRRLLACLPIENDAEGTPLPGARGARWPARAAAERRRQGERADAAARRATSISVRT